MSVVEKTTKATPMSRPSGTTPSGRRSAKHAPEPSVETAWNYGVDAWQRTVLFWDALRRFVLADAISENRRPLSDDHPYIQTERQLASRVSDAMENARKVRDGTYEQMFSLLFGGLSERNLDE